MCDEASPRKKRKYSEGTKESIMERVWKGEKITDVGSSQDPVIPISTISTWKQKYREKSKCNSVQNTEAVHQDQNTEAVHQDQNTEDVHQDQNTEAVHQDQNTEAVHQDQNTEAVHQDQNTEAVHQDQNTEAVHQDQNTEAVHQDQNTEAVHQDQSVVPDDRNKNKRRVKREKVKDEQVNGNWTTDWELIMSPVQKEGFVGRDGCEKGFRRDNIETLFPDHFGIFELQIRKDDSKEVKYLRNGRISTLLLRYCNDGYQKSNVLKQVLSADYSVLVRCHYFNSDNDKGNAAASLRQLLSRYDYAWNKTLREYIDDEDIPENWSDWVTVLTPHHGAGWKLRNNKDSGKDYRRENLTNSFEEKYGTFEMKVGCSCDTNGEVSRDQNDDTDVVSYIGKGNILTEVRKQCFDETKQSTLIDQALKEGKDISIRYCYTKNDTLEEAEELERLLLERYDYAWIRSKREDVYDNDLPGKWSEWLKIMKPGVVEDGWACRDDRFAGKVKTNLEGIYKDQYGIFEMAIEEPYQDVVVHVGKGKILSQLKEYCRINTDGSYKFHPISDALSRRCNILVRYRYAQSEEDAEHIENQLLTRYDYSWNWTKKEEVDDNCLPINNWSEWKRLMTPNRNGPNWTRRDQGHIGFCNTEELKVIDKIISGVYEWMVKKDQRAIVVYTGKTENLLTRLSDYCKNGSHKSEDRDRDRDRDKDNLEYFNKALHYDYTIYARFRYTGQISDEENILLHRYDYAWNKVQNGMERDIFL